LKKTQARLIEAEKRALEHRITGGFAHEMRNALAGAQLELSAISNYRGKGCSAAESATQATIRLFEAIETLHREYGIPRERIAGEIVPHVKDISSILTELSKVMEGVHQDLERGLSITNQIREYARISEVRPGSGDLPLMELLKGYRKRYERDFEVHGITYSVEGPEDVACRGEQVHMDSIFGNLIRNAKDALLEKNADHKQINVKVEEKNGAAGKRIVVHVQDNGPGITGNHAPEIFEPFFSTKPSTGTGLGLAIVKRLVHLYGGTIELQSRENQEGAGFVVTLPKEPMDRGQGEEKG
jgi:histidine kinase